MKKKTKKISKELISFFKKKGILITYNMFYKLYFIHKKVSSKIKINIEISEYIVSSLKTDSDIITFVNKQIKLAAIAVKNNYSFFQEENNFRSINKELIDAMLVCTYYKINMFNILEEFNNDVHHGKNLIKFKKIKRLFYEKIASHIKTNAYYTYNKNNKNKTFLFTEHISTEDWIYDMIKVMFDFMKRNKNVIYLQRLIDKKIVKPLNL